MSSSIFLVGKLLEKRLTGTPSGVTRNFSKFQAISLLLKISKWVEAIIIIWWLYYIELCIIFILIFDNWFFLDRVRYFFICLTWEGSTKLNEGLTSKLRARPKRKWTSQMCICWFVFLCLCALVFTNSCILNPLSLLLSVSACLVWPPRTYLWQGEGCL